MIIIVQALSNACSSPQNVTQKKIPTAKKCAMWKVMVWIGLGNGLITCNACALVAILTATRLNHVKLNVKGLVISLGFLMKIDVTTDIPHCTLRARSAEMRKTAK